MAKINVLAGNFLQGDSEYREGAFRLKTPFNPALGVKVQASAFKTLEVASEDSVANKDAIGYGIAGAMLLGPVGAIAGYLMAGKETEITFIATFKDGSKLLAATDSDTYRDISRHMSH
ncbi:hypothetical protein BK659_09185 [Pseudomonas brassicacearum]|uniref:Uncharacterized protein n=1 Tax=Pseudomonas brassicacearum TaxID=930166 RepID=A0A423HA82_9PSED|nr:hypothetical protein [Pseudomonas brassicacearum]RON10066.1 hypothetical protein BK659_09185 [Pseudomonas brassicacearum]